MAAQTKCSSCGANLKAGAKFCPSCGNKVEVQVIGSGLTLSSVIDHLRKEADELDNGVFKALFPMGDERSQLVFVLASEDADGDADLDDLTIWSNFAPARKVTAKKVIEMDGWGFGITQIGDLLAVQTSIRPWQLVNLKAFDWILERVALVADHYERTSLGSDDY
jgi:hypothetical protein